MAQWVRGLAAPTEDSTTVSSTHLSSSQSPGNLASGDQQLTTGLWGYLYSTFIICPLLHANKIIIWKYSLSATLLHLLSSGIFFPLLCQRYTRHCPIGVRGHGRQEGRFLMMMIWPVTQGRNSRVFVVVLIWLPWTLLYLFTFFHL